MQVNDCFYSKKYSSVYIVTKIVSEDFIEVNDLFAFKTLSTRCSYAVYSIPRQLKVSWMHGYKQIDSASVFKILKILRLNNIACEAIIKKAPILKVSSIYLYDFEHYFCIKNKDHGFDIGSDLLCTVEATQNAAFRHVSLQVFREIETIVNDNLDLIDDLWNSFSELKANG